MMAEYFETCRGRLILGSVIIAGVVLSSWIRTANAQPPGTEREERIKKTVVSIDPSNKKNISGFVSITNAIGSSLKTPRGVGAGMINLKEAMLKWTKIDTRVDQQVRLSSPELFKQPFVYIAFEGGFDLTESERSNLKQYLENGGFIVMEQFALAKEQDASGSAFARMMQPVLGSNARVAPLQNSNALYHSFFDFTDGPPIGGEMKSQVVGSTYSQIGGDVKKTDFEISQKAVNYLEGITMNGRLVGICSSKKYLDKWQERSNNEPQLRMGVNMIVFALTQQGGMASR